MRTVKEISVLNPLEAYNTAIRDCASNAALECVGDPIRMAMTNCAKSDITFFAVDEKSILNLIVKEK